MKKNELVLSILIVACIVFTFFQGCKKSGNTTTYGIYKFVFKTTAEVRSQIKSMLPTPIVTVGKIYVKDDYLFVNEPNKGIHIFDNSNPKNPINKAFINIPGCEDMAVFGNSLYADCYTDLFTIDISNPLQISLTGHQENMFPDRRNVNGMAIDSGLVISDWIKIKDTTVNSNDYAQSGYNYSNGFWYAAPVKLSPPISYYLLSTALTANMAGTAGSTARFAIQNKTLYTVTQTTLNILSLAEPKNPVFIKSVNFGWGIETIYPLQDNLFIGSSTGVYIYDVSNAQNPTTAGFFGHYQLCDPVIADGHYAYVTLHGGSNCHGNINEMDVLDITSTYNPVLIKKIPLTSPRGLAKIGNTLIVCDGGDGLKIFDASNPANPILKQKINMAETNDLIISNNSAIVAATDGLYQFSNNDSLTLLSKIGL